MEALSSVFIDSEETKRQILFGAARATSFIKKVVAGEAVDGRKYGFDADFVMELHNRVFMAPGVKGFLRETDSTIVDGRSTASAQEAKWKFHLFGRWLEEQMVKLKDNPEDVAMALEIATAAHYGLVMPQLHPFDNGNGRTARALLNAILMSETYELTVYGLAVPPVPILRANSNREDDYIRALRKVGATGDLHPFMVFVAQQWERNLQERLKAIRLSIKTPKTDGDRKLIQKLENRLKILGDFIRATASPNHGTAGNGYHRYPVPNYFEMRYVKA